MALELAVRTSAEARVRAVLDDGYAYLPQVLDAAAAAELRDHIDGLELDPEAFDRRMVYDTHVKVGFNHDACFLRFLGQEPVASLAEGSWAKTATASG